MPETTTDPTAWVAALRGSVDHLAALTGPLPEDQLRTTSYADEWSIAQVVSHLGSGAEIFRGIMMAARRGDPLPDAASYQQIWDRWNALDPVEQVAAGNRSAAEFLAAVESLDPDERDRFAVELFGSTADLQQLLALRLGEHTVHLWDIEVVLDEQATLAPDAVNLMIDDLGRLAGWLQPAPGLSPVIIATTDPSRTFRLTFDPVSLEPVEGSDAHETPVVLPAEAFIRLLYGRLDPRHSHRVPDDERLDALREAFPGF